EPWIIRSRIRDFFVSSGLSPDIVCEVADDLRQIRIKRGLGLPVTQAPVVVFPNVKQETLKDFVGIVARQVQVPRENCVDELSILRDESFKCARFACEQARDEIGVVIESHGPVTRSLTASRHRAGEDEVSRSAGFELLKS